MPRETWDTAAPNLSPKAGEKDGAPEVKGRVRKREPPAHPKLRVEPKGWATRPRFRDKQALCSYAGRVPRVRESAGKAARGGITRQGSPWLRWIMVEAAQVAVRSSPAARKYFQRLERRKHRHVARVALARKLLIAVYALLHDGVVFDEEKFAAV